MATMSHWTVRWLAPIAAAGAMGLVACGSDDARETRSDGADVVVGSDRHLDNQAAEAAERAADGGAASSDSGLPDPWVAGNRAAARALQVPG